MSATVLVCGNMFDRSSEALSGPAEILVERNRIASIGRSVNRPPGAQVIELSDRTVAPGFIDAHVHLTMDASNLMQQALGILLRAHLLTEGAPNPVGGETHCNMWLIRAARERFRTRS